MPHRYKQLALDQATSGMVLSDDLLDNHSNVLLPKGTLLSDTLLTSLRRHQIEVLTVIDCELTADQQASQCQHYQQRIAHLFRRPDPNEFSATNLLRQYVQAFRYGVGE